MKSDLTAYQRRNHIKNFLTYERQTTKLKLSYMYGVSIQTIRRDIDYLSEQLPIVTKPGNGGGIFLAMDVEKNKEFLEADEKDCLLRMLPFANERDKLILTNIIHKFSLPATS